MANFKLKTVISMKVSGDSPSHARTDITARDTGFSIDEPVARGGTNTGPSPTETAVSALIGCTNVIGHKCADKLGVDIGHLSIEAECVFDRSGVTLAEEIDLPFQRVTLDVAASGSVSADDLARVAAEVAKYCPLSKLFRQAGTELIENWRKA